MGFESPAAALIFAVTIAASLIGLYSAPQLIDRFVMRPYQVARGRQTETVFTSGFVHGDLGHLLFNMFTYFWFAFPLEQFLGTVKFALLYTLGLAMSATCSVFKHRDNPGYATLGARTLCNARRSWLISPHELSIRPG